MSFIIIGIAVYIIYLIAAYFFGPVIDWFKALPIAIQGAMIAGFSVIIANSAPGSEKKDVNAEVIKNKILLYSKILNFIKENYLNYSIETHKSIQTANSIVLDKAKESKLKEFIDSNYIGITLFAKNDIIIKFSEYCKSRDREKLEILVKQLRMDIDNYDVTSVEEFEKFIDVIMPSNQEKDQNILSQDKEKE